jgi:hypothetical protein
MIKRVFMTLDDLKILCKGAIGSMTFGAYHMYITTNMINENNRNNQLRIDENNRNNQLRIDENNRNNEIKINEIDKNNQLRFEEINRNNHMRIDELMKKIEKLENKRYFF